MASTRRSITWLLILIGAVIFAAGAAWVTQFVFKPAPGGDDGRADRNRHLHCNRRAAFCVRRFDAEGKANLANEREKLAPRTGRAEQVAIERCQREAQIFGKGYVPSIVRRHVVSKFPDTSCN